MFDINDLRADEHTLPDGGRAGDLTHVPTHELLNDEHKLADRVVKVEKQRTWFGTVLICLACWGSFFILHCVAVGIGVGHAFEADYGVLGDVCLIISVPLSFLGPTSLLIVPAMEAAVVVAILRLVSGSRNW